LREKRSRMKTVPESDRRRKLIESTENAQYPWYVLQVKAGREQSTAFLLRQKGLAGFLPLYTSSRRWSDRTKLLEIPLFPGYVFCRFDVQNRLPILTTPGVLQVIGMGGVPEPVDETEIAGLQRVVRSGLLMQPWPFLKIGERVSFQDGPLRNVQGVLTEIKGQSNLIVSITLLQRSVAVRVERAAIRPVAA
jgi:transcription antitermination factor NusG